jgi:hypothetical protein
LYLAAVTQNPITAFVLQKPMKAVLIAITALCGSVGSAADRVVDDPVALDSVDSWSRLKSLIETSGGG